MLLLDRICLAFIVGCAVLTAAAAVKVLFFAPPAVVIYRWLDEAQPPGAPAVYFPPSRVLQAGGCTCGDPCDCCPACVGKK